MPAKLSAPGKVLSESAILLKAALRAADWLGISGKTFGLIIGVSEATVSRLRWGEAGLERGSKPFELTFLFIRLFRSLDAILGGDQTVARAWMSNPNTALGACPADIIRTIPGLFNVIAYLDARRAII